MAIGLLISTLSKDDRLMRFTYSQYHMGGDARIIVYAASQAQAETACSAAYERIAELDSILSDYRKESELMRLCGRRPGERTLTSIDLFTVLKRAAEISKFSGGAFDVTVGPLVQLWREARKTASLPSPEALTEARRRTGWESISIDDKQPFVTLKKSGMQLDLGGIGKGYAADEAQRVLVCHGIKCALVEMGGDIVVTGPPPGQDGWIIRVPNAGDGAEIVDLPFTHCALSTSGDTEQFTIIDGVQYSHVVDPRSGLALDNRLQATVVANSGLIAEPISTALTVLPIGEHPAFLKKVGGIKAYIRTLASGGSTSP